MLWMGDVSHFSTEAGCHMRLLSMGVRAACNEKHKQGLGGRLDRQAVPVQVVSVLVHVDLLSILRVHVLPCRTSTGRTQADFAPIGQGIGMRELISVVFSSLY